MGRLQRLDSPEGQPAETVADDPLQQRPAPVGHLAAGCCHGLRHTTAEVKSHPSIYRRIVTAHWFLRGRRRMTMSSLPPNAVCPTVSPMTSKPLEPDSVSSLSIVEVRLVASRRYSLFGSAAPSSRSSITTTSLPPKAVLKTVWARYSYPSSAAS